MAIDESARSKHVRSKINYVDLLLNQGVVTEDMLNYDYTGSGTKEDPYAVTWITNDPRNPMLWSTSRRWTYMMIMAIATMAVALTSSAYTGGIREIMMQFRIQTEVATLGVSLFVLYDVHAPSWFSFPFCNHPSANCGLVYIKSGFAIGPLLWAPMSELYGRQLIFTITFGGLTVFDAGCTGSKNAATLIILRFLAGSFGSSPLTNAGGIIAESGSPHNLLHSRLTTNTDLL